MYLSTVMLLLVVCGALGGGNANRGYETTSATGGFSVSIASHRNSTGHWIASVNVSSAERSRRGPRGLTLHVGQDVLFCEETETVKLSATVVVRGVVPPAGYQVVNGLGYYKFHTSAVSWETARDRCEADGAHLIIVNSDREADVVKELFVRHPKIKNATHVDSYVHVGFHDRYIEKQFITLDGEPLASSGYMKWAPGNPKHIDTHCGVIARDALYHDTFCSTTTYLYYFICEFP